MATGLDPLMTLRDPRTASALPLGMSSACQCCSEEPAFMRPCNLDSKDSFHALLHAGNADVGHAKPS